MPLYTAATVVSLPLRARHASCQLDAGHQGTYVNDDNDDRAPPLFIAGGADHVMPPSVNESNVRHYRKSKTVTDYKELRAAPTTRRAGRLGGGRRLCP